MTEKRNSIAREQAEFITDFNEIGDWLMQYSCLLELTADMKPVLPEEKNSHTKISGCQAGLCFRMKMIMSMFGQTVIL
mgnify:CR=1 FL=1